VVRKENENLSTSLANQFRAKIEKLMQELGLEIQTEVQTRTKEIELLKNYTEIGLVY
jgi:polyhydroxyalkanoate synthesis regulator phasin